MSTSKNLKKRARLERIWLVQSGLCHICGKLVPRPGTVHSLDDYAATIDHVVPKSYGNHCKPSWNYLMAHRACNKSRGSKFPSISTLGLAQMVGYARVRIAIEQDMRKKR